MRKRLWSRSIPFAFSAVTTSSFFAVLPLSLNVDDPVADESFLTIRATSSCEPSTTREPPPGRSTTSAKHTETRVCCRLGYAVELWIRSVAFAWRSFFALKPKTKISASKTFDLPEPFGPTTADMFESNGPIVTSLAYDLKFSRIIFWMTSRGGALVARASDMVAARKVCETRARRSAACVAAAKGARGWGAGAGGGARRGLLPCGAARASAQNGARASAVRKISSAPATKRWWWAHPGAMGDAPRRQGRQRGVERRGWLEPESG